MGTFLALIGFLAIIVFLVLSINPKMLKWTRNFSRKKTLLFALMGLVVLGVGGTIGGSDTATTGAVVSDADAKVKADTKAREKAEAKAKAKADADAKVKADIKAKADADAKAKAEEEAKIAKIGDTLQVGDDLFRVNSIQTKQTIGDKFMSQTASGTYLIVDVTLKNGEKKAITTNSSFFKLVVGDVEYEADAVADFYVNGKHSMFLQKINPGITYTAKVAFDIPTEVSTANNLMLNVQTGYWGTEQGQIALKKK
ncbi:hypothetical protein Back11_60490 [Paenibacillus baekrokdamisoli]|uniref:DUF4352 domain-containing protein n=1 Tax=Paenibacillus baekrokdamisoli TaxID=1712516 RepID=A0A3G9JPC5_9BACL|nr:DUF4352 domain-containing protein [Paenibacillus baekrokdamisoli]MBB3072120.1 hypothetical protein [Paenibacillus baekrokdamisoli]BBH24704.1 hypothetical protein Back11_60490 [Paenibacillus baekrokdamisoli]